jgi:dihydrolipoamide dehydrogenase
MYLSNGVDRIEYGNVYLKTGEILQPQKVLLAVGRIPQKLDGCEVCIGDACGKIQLAHFAIKQAVEEISNIEFDKTLVPSVVYGNPEIAWVGKREQDLEEGNYKKSNLLISALGKSHCDNSTDGFIKILSKDNKIVGAHIVSKEAAALIQQITIAMQAGMTIYDLKKVCFAHPTYSEGIFESLFR